MSAPLTCPHGHPWQPGDDDPSSSRPPLACPVCGVAYESEPTQALDAILASRPNLRASLADDPEATIASDRSRSKAAVEEPPAEIGPALRSAVPGYEILQELGRGGMGVVYKARDLRLNRLVALKMVLAGVHVGPRDLVRFRSEAAAVAALQHPNIVQVYEVGEQEGRPYFSLEYVEGGSLAQHLNGRTLPPSWCAELVETLARAVHYAHQRGIVHRDLKPANILLASGGREPPDGVAPSENATPSASLRPPFAEHSVKITDFGLAKQLGGAAITHSGTVLGTPSYMAPEQALGKNSVVGPAADIYALGSILYEMLTGRPPFRAETTLDTMLQVASQEPAPISRLQARVPRDLQTICLKCLEKEPWKRYASAEGLADDLRRFRSNEPILARPVGNLERAYKWARRRPSLAALILLLVCTTLLGFATMAWMWHAEAEQVRLLADAQKDTEAALAKAEVSLYCNRIALAEREWLANNVTRARHLLADCPPAMRQWEWHYLHRLCHADLLTLRGPDSTILSMAFNELQHLAAISEDQTLKIWDTASGRSLFSRREGTERDRSAVLVYGPGGTLHCASAMLPVRVWDLARRDKALRQSWPLDRVAVVAFSGDRRMLAAGLKDGCVKVWDLVTSRELFRIHGHGAPITAIAFGPGGKLIATGDLHGNVKLWDGSQGKELAQLVRQSGPIYVLAFSPDGRRLASAGGDPIVRLWEATTGNLLYTLRGHTHPASALAFSPVGSLLASGGRDQMVKVWDTSSGEETFTIRGHTNQISSLAFSLDGRLLASAARDQTVRIWDATSGQEARTLRARLASHGAAFRPDGKRLATANSEVAIWDPLTSRLVRSFGASNRILESLVYSPDGKRLAVAGWNGVHVWDPVTREDLLTLTQPTARFRCVAYSPDGKLLAAAGEDGTVRLWDAHKGDPVRILNGHAKAVTSIAFSSDGTRLLSGSLDHAVKLWDVATGNELLELAGHAGPVSAVAFSAKGYLLASGAVSPGSSDSESGAEGEIKVWDATTGELRHTLWGHTGEVTSVAFTPDGARLASGSDDHTVKIWDPVLGQEVLTLRGHTSTVQTVVFSPDGGQLVSTAADQTVRIWNATPLR
jgi:WD40 repeat protein/serine/threonine protein kinase